MNNTSIFIDDTGLSGNISNSSSISQNSVTWSALILNYEEKKEIESLIRKTLGIIQREYSVTEFHFKDIYGGRKEFKGLPTELRLLIISLFVEIYNKYVPKIIAVSINENTLTNSGFSDKIKRIKMDGFNYNKPKDVALHLLLLNCKEYIESNSKDFQLPVEIFIDNGRQKPNTKQKVTDLSEICTNGEIEYLSSVSSPLLQFADFIAFSLNRIQTNSIKQRTEFDDEFMRIVGRIKWNTNLPLMQVKASNMDSLNLDFYDKYMNNILDSMPKIDKKQ
ncbi:DUF3800 domain-containing protein [Clostridium sp. JS66]|uniref:DUF3800 domain-containing protein n=1 Tax=Clostridium sp. JS66 TaxID=3064705 RepID=UPI00298DE880|nr:DUF3800 domain-containing protein [Clostridium sp. JS66]WPC42393.1 DUF3800 domain-containing protein [Clostridium sp. JS66]